MFGKPVESSEFFGCWRADLAGCKRKRHNSADGGLAESRRRTFDGHRRICARSTGLGTRTNSHTRLAYPIFLDNLISHLPHLETRRKKGKIRMTRGARHAEVSRGGHFGARRLQGHKEGIAIHTATRCLGEGHPKMGRSTERAGSPIGNISSYHGHSSGGSSLAFCMSPSATATVPGISHGVI